MHSSALYRHEVHLNICVCPQEALQSERGPSPKMMKVVPRERLQGKGSAAAQQPQHPAAIGAVEQTKPLTENEQTAVGRLGTAEEPEAAAHPQHIDGQTFYDAQEGDTSAAICRAEQMRASWNALCSFVAAPG